MTVQELGKLMKTKYPQYQDIPDDELGNRILAKYPEYQSRISRPEVKEKTGTAQKILGGIASITGGKKIAEAGAQLLGGGQESLATQNSQVVETLIVQAKKYPQGHPRRTELLKQAHNVAQNYSSIADERLAALPTQKEVAGSAVKLGTTIGTLGLGAASAGSVGGRILETGSKLGGISAISGGATAFEEGLGRSEAVKGAIGSGIVGFGLGTVGQSIAELATYLTSPAITEGLYNKALGISKKTIEKGKSPSGRFLDEGISGTKRGILAKAQSISQASDNEIEKVLISSKRLHNSKDIIKQITTELQKKFANTLGPDDIKVIVDKLPINKLRTGVKINDASLNALRKELDNNFLGNARWLNESTTERILGLKTATNVMRGIVQSADDRLPAIFSRWSDAITASKALRSELAKPHIMSNMLELLTSLVIGGATGGISLEGLKNALYTFGAINAGQSTLTKTGLARTLSKLGQTSGVGIGNVVKTLVPGISAEITK